MSDRQCLKCNARIESTAPTGRPKSYCSVTCRRAAEFEIKRLNSLLGRAEKALQDHRLGRDGSWDENRRRRDRELVEKEIMELEVRLQALLAGQSGDS